MSVKIPDFEVRNSGNTTLLDFELGGDQLTAEVIYNSNPKEENGHRDLISVRDANTQVDVAITPEIKHTVNGIIDLMTTRLLDHLAGDEPDSDEYEAYLAGEEGS
ncbi:hypothetical protein JKY72_04640 [Candidatus Gracilibacteria bacterium]|nr:hypothetical protein [Candidatus Gracilibacteria bacterium]